MVKRMRFQLSGRVQGVGARPWICRLAESLHLSGFVRNDTSGVYIEAQGPPESLNAFGAALTDTHRPDYPTQMRVEHCRWADRTGCGGAALALSQRVSGSPTTGVAPDTAVCAACLAEMNDPHDFRYRYPFITCTHCGPRYTLIKAIPYDRPNTTMAEFELCDRCRSRYEDIATGGFMPSRWRVRSAGRGCGWPMLKVTIGGGFRQGYCPCRSTAGRGQIVAVKGIGGFHLAVDALNDAAVQRLRQRRAVGQAVGDDGGGHANHSTLCQRQ